MGLFLSKTSYSVSTVEASHLQYEYEFAFELTVLVHVYMKEFGICHVTNLIVDATMTAAPRLNKRRRSANVLLSVVPLAPSTIRGLVLSHLLAIFS